MGHYERFIDLNLTKSSNVTTGKIYWSVISKERKGDFLGGTIQVIPHITNEIKSRIKRAAKQSEVDVVITEIGGTVGDIESLPFLEAIRQMKGDIGRENVMYIHVTLIPYLAKSGELKTKPTQHSVKELRSIGIQPDVIVCRTEHALSRDIKDKIALFCDIDPKAVIENSDAALIYEVPLKMHAEGLDEIVTKKLGLSNINCDLSEWCALVERSKTLRDKVVIGLVGKYVALRDAYLSVAEALAHGGFENDCAVDIRWIQAEDVEKQGAEALLAGLDGILVPGGFGDRGIEGKIAAVRHARENKIPFFGICLGVHCAVIEYARNVCGWHDAHSTEFNPDTTHPVIDLLPEQSDIEELGGTMRLGLYPCKVEENTFTYAAYKEEIIYERHRHRYELNNVFRERFVKQGLVMAGTSPDGRLVEVVEISEHPWFVASQFHPEFKSRPNRAHPLFRDFIGASLVYCRSRDC